MAPPVAVDMRPADEPFVALPLHASRLTSHLSRITFHETDGQPMKWVFLGALVLVLALTVVVQATRPAEKSTGAVKLIWATDDNPARVEQMQLFRDWHRKHYGEEIDIALDPTNTGIEKVVIQSLAGVGPDLFDFYGRSNLERYVESGIILDVTKEARRHHFEPERIWPGVRTSFVYEDRQYGFPDNAANLLILYHKDVFDRAGVPHPKPDWTWDDFLRIAPKLSYQDEKGLRHFALQGASAYDMMLSNGASLFTPHGTRCTLDSPEAREALRFYVDLRLKYHAIPSPAELASQSAAGGWGGGSVNVFATKYFAMATGGRYWIIQYAKDTRALLEQGKPAPFTLGVAQVPRFKRHACTGGARCTGVNRNSKHARHAVRFLAFLASEQFNRQINRSFDALAPGVRYCKGPTGIADGPAPPPGLECANDPAWAKAMEYTLEMDRSPFLPPYRVSFLFNEVMGTLDAGQTTPDESLRAFAHLVDGEIQRNVEKHPRLRALYEKCKALDEKATSRAGEWENGRMGEWESAEVGGRGENAWRTPALSHSPTRPLPHSPTRRDAEEARR